MNDLLDGTLTAAEAAVAITRIQAPPDSVDIMPPTRFMHLTPDEQQTLVNFVKAQMQQ